MTGCSTTKQMATDENTKVLIISFHSNSQQSFSNLLFQMLYNNQQRNKCKDTNVRLQTYDALLFITEFPDKGRMKNSINSGDVENVLNSMTGNFRHFQ